MSKTSESAPLVDTYSPDDLAQRDDMQLRTSMALLFHTRRNGHGLELLTVHDINNVRGVSTIGAGTPLTPEAEQRILDLLTKPIKDTAMTFLPENLLYSDRMQTMWFISSAVRKMHLRDNQGIVSSITTRWPNLVLLTRNRLLYIVAVADDKRPTPQTPIFHAPLGNLYSSTNLCTGNATLPMGCSVSDIASWESIVFDTAWTHANHNDVYRPLKKSKAPEDIEAFWAKRDKHVAPFPQAHLVPMKITLGEWIEYLTERGE